MFHFRLTCLLLVSIYRVLNLREFIYCEGYITQVIKQDCLTKDHNKGSKDSTMIITD